MAGGRREAILAPGEVRPDEPIARRRRDSAARVPAKGQTSILAPCHVEPDVSCLTCGDSETGRGPMGNHPGKTTEDSCPRQEVTAA
jgi:hypothetical protein